MTEHAASEEIKAFIMAFPREYFDIGNIQRRFRIGYSQAAKAVEFLEEQGIVGPYDPKLQGRRILKREGGQGGE